MNQTAPMQLDKHTQTIRTFLTRWRGGVARLWAFQAAHCQLTIRIEKPVTPGNLHVMCVGPTFIHGSVQWQDCALDVCTEQNTSGGVTTYLLQDARADFAVRTEEIEVKEHCKPLF